MLYQNLMPHNQFGRHTDFILNSLGVWESGTIQYMQTEVKKGANNKKRINKTEFKIQCMQLGAELMFTLHVVF